MKTHYITIQKTSKTPKTIYLLSILGVPIGVLLMITGSQHPDTEYIQANIGLLVTLSCIPLRMLSKFITWWLNG